MNVGSCLPHSWGFMWGVVEEDVKETKNCAENHELLAYLTG